MLGLVKFSEAIERAVKLSVVLYTLRADFTPLPLFLRYSWIKALCFSVNLLRGFLFVFMGVVVGGVCVTSSSLLLFGLSIVILCGPVFY